MNDREARNSDLMVALNALFAVSCGIDEESLEAINTQWLEASPSWLETFSASFASARPKLLALVKNETGYLCLHYFKHPTKFYGISEDDLPHLSEGAWQIEGWHYWPKDNTEANYGQAVLLVTGQVDHALGNWQPATHETAYNLRQRQHIDLMHELVLRGQLEEANGWGNETFASAGRAERLLLDAIEQDLRSRGRASDDERLELSAINTRSLARRSDLQAQLTAIQNQIAELKAVNDNALYEALERHVGFKQRQVIRHHTQGTIGTIVRRDNGAPELTLQTQPDMRLWQCSVITDELRRGEWQLIDQEPFAPPQD